tara:strand:- start:16330 stop:16872 length:543 start_codon:yes stop_codon:yes gene_type:complete
MSENKVGRKVILNAGLNYGVYDVEKPRDEETDEYKKGLIDEYADVLCYTSEKGEIQLGTLKEIKKERDEKRKHGQLEKFKDELFVDDSVSNSRYSIGKISDFGHDGKKRLYVCARRTDTEVNNYKEQEIQELDQKEKEMEEKTLNKSKGGKRKSRRHRKSKKSRKGKSRKNRRKSNRRCR